MDLGLDANGQSQPQVKNLHSLKCWKKVLFVVLNHCSSNLDVPMNRICCWDFLTRVIETFQVLLSFTWAGNGQKLKPKFVSSADSYPYVSSLVWAFFMCLTPLWIVISSKHPASRTLLYSGWEPVITAMVISRCVCVFSLLKEKEQLSRVCTSQRLVCMMTHPLNKLRHPSTYTLRSPWAWRPYRGASRKQITVPLTLSHSLLSTISAADITDPHRL